jgi:ATP-dependent Clp protease ATP-binding subunit ClpA
MFERYTEKARRTIFFARYEASKTGSREIETSHLLLGLLRENHNLLGDPHAAATFVQQYRVEITPDQAEQIPTSVDLPLSHPSKRVLAYGAEEATQMGHRHIGTDHIFMGLLREDKNIAARLSRDHGIDISVVRDRVSKTVPPSESPSRPGAFLEDRDTLHVMIDALPEAALTDAFNMLKLIQTRAARLTAALEKQGLRPLGGFAGSSSTRIEDGVQTRETHWLIQDHDIALVESLKMDQHANKLTYTHHLRGPKTTHQFELDIDLT